MADRRLYHLDALRSFSILYGLLVHAATIGVSFPLTLISDVSGYFRMSAFFLVSGFFSAMVLARAGPGLFLRRRAVALLVPFFTGLVLFNPATLWLIYCWHTAPIGFLDYLRELPAGRGPMVWHLHLWFLLSLSVYVLAAVPLAWGAGRMARPLTHLADRLAALPDWAAVILAGAVTAAVAVALRGGYEVLIDPALARTPIHGKVQWLCRTTTYYLPFFVWGMAMYHHAGLADRLQRVSLPAIAAGLALVWVVPRIGGGDTLNEIATIFARGFLTFSLVTALMAAFRRWLSRPGILSSLAGSVYSIYIIHFLVIYLVAFALRPLGLDRVTLYLAIVLGTGVVVLTIHRLVIRPVPLLSFLLNGKPLTSRRIARGA